VNETEGETLYATAGVKENTLDYWAGYAVNPDDAERLRPLINRLGVSAPLLKEVGSFQGAGKDELVFDLGGNVAEWGVGKSGNGRLYGGSADTPVDSKVRRRQPSAEYTGFRVIQSSSTGRVVQ
jgi:hypothetical protein